MAQNGHDSDGSLSDSDDLENAAPEPKQVGNTARHPSFAPHQHPVAVPVYNAPSVHTSSPLASQGRQKARSASNAIDMMPGGSPPRRKRLSAVPGVGTGLLSSSLAKYEVTNNEIGGGLLSDEYDLSHEDPLILKDVHRALKLKARREARLKSGQSNSLVKTDPYGSLRIGPMSTLHPFPREPSGPLSSSSGPDVDFSPSTAEGNKSNPVKTAIHPVPVSNDNGVSLDWSGPGIEDEKSDRRWTISMTKRKGKDRDTYVSPKVLEKQNSIYESRVQRIKAIASPQTNRKVHITKQQLERRYSIIYGSLLSGEGRITLPKVVRWLSGLDSNVKSALEKAEPLTWLKHLDKRVPRQHEQHLPWHLSALAIEEYINAQAAQTRAQMRSSISPLEYSPVPPSLVPASPSRSSFQYSMGPSLSRIVGSDTGRVSFEPAIQPRQSFEVSSHKSRDSYNSMFSGSSVIIPNTDPSFNTLTGGRFKSRDYGAISPGRSQNESDGGSSRISFHSDDGVKKIALPSSSSGRKESEAVSDSPSAKFRPIPAQKENIHDEIISVIPPSTSSSPIATPQRLLGRRPRRISLPADDRLSTIMEQRRRHEADVVKADREYDIKSQLLEDAAAQNSKTRQLLKRISGRIKEYEITHSNLSETLGVPYTRLPQELLDAFSHDPAYVTGATRQLTGYLAVDDIHNRIVRQRDIFRTFLEDQASCGSMDLREDYLKDPIATLLQSLESVDTVRKEISEQVVHVASVLKEVQAVHAVVKYEYNEALRCTSTTYPELSQIRALEESYKDQYQHIWELGMDALTFVFDTVTPFWRTYGKTIGTDVRDFLIVPLYRNEFTGESKRYAITQFPSRSFRHWVALFLLFWFMVALTVLQARAATTSSIHFRLHWIPYEGIRWTALPFFWLGIVIQWVAVLTELFIVVTQLGVILWWMAWWVGLHD